MLTCAFQFLDTNLAVSFYYSHFDYHKANFETLIKGHSHLRDAHDKFFALLILRFWKFCGGVWSRGSARRSVMFKPKNFRF